MLSVRERELCSNLAAEFSIGRDYTRPEEHGRDAGVFRDFSAEPIDILVLAGTDALHADNHRGFAHEIVTWPAASREIVREVVLMQAIAAEGELRVRLEEEGLVTK